ncbi:MAG: SRPBCC domain-containing protein [Pseudomonadota bacterium]|nr:SRPBCC domain-containing protein [Pseudomonadota bacterium]
MTAVMAKAATMIAAPPLVCYEAFATPDQMTKFWFPKVSGPIEKGVTLTWYVGTATDAHPITVTITEAMPGERIEMRWGDGEAMTDVTWTFIEKGPLTEVKITEHGFEGDAEAQAAQAIDSTGGFSQVLIAAKALIEHDVAINVVADRAAG